MNVELFGREHSDEEFVAAVLAVTDEADARAFWDAYLGWLRGRVAPVEETEAVARRFLGWCFRMGFTSPTQAQLWAVYGVVPGVEVEDAIPEAAEATESSPSGNADG